MFFSTFDHFHTSTYLISYQMEQLLAKHKKEQRELVAQITALKKQALKKTRKTVLSQCADLQSSLDARQKTEVEQFELNSTDNPLQTNSDHANAEECSLNGGILAQESQFSGATGSNAESEDVITKNGESNENDTEEITPEQLLAAMNLEPPAPVVNDESTPTQKPKKRNRAKERLAKRQAQEEAIRAEARSEAAATPDYRAMEAETMNRLLESRDLELYEIQPDGHCLFRSLCDQLRLRHNDNDVTVEGLRSTAANYIRDHRDDFIPYLFDEETMAIRDVDGYTQELETTAMWGSDMEILALSKVYDCAVEVLTAGGAPITFNAEGERNRLYVAFYKHSYGLGEHYNSCRPVN